jgi:hypothetical protein
MTAGQPRCHRCRQPVILARTLPGLARIQLDTEPTPEGNYDLDLDAVPTPTARWRRAFGVPHYGPPLHACHLETCPQNPERDDDSPAVPSAAASGQ